MDAFQIHTDLSTLFIRGSNRRYVPAPSDAIVEAALQIISRQIGRGDALSSPRLARDYAQLKLGKLEHEVFALFILDSQHRLIEYVEVFRGTIDGCTVHPREVVKMSLARNAAAVILVHNHPSGSVEPSQADRRITERLREALALLDIRVLDHLIVGGADVMSFSERGLL